MTLRGYRLLWTKETQLRSMFWRIVVMRRKECLEKHYGMLQENGQMVAYTVSSEKNGKNQRY